MAITKQDLQDFNRFADMKLAGGGASSLVDLSNARQRPMAKRKEDLRRLCFSELPPRDSVLRFARSALLLWQWQF